MHILIFTYKERYIFLAVIGKICLYEHVRVEMKKEMCFNVPFSTTEIELDFQINVIFCMLNICLILVSFVW